MANTVYITGLGKFNPNVTKDTYVAVSEETTDKMYKAIATDCLWTPYHTGVGMNINSLPIPAGNSLGPPNFTKTYEVPGSVGGLSAWTLYEGYFTPPFPGMFLLDFNFLFELQVSGTQEASGYVVIEAECRTSQHGSLFFSARSDANSTYGDSLVDKYGGIGMQIFWEERNPDASTYMSFDIYNKYDYAINLVRDRFLGVEENDWVNTITATLISK